jgi:AbrB family looped-hinge helix DNA binding protein
MSTKTNPSCCHIEAVTSIDERGQMVIPKEIRDKAGFQAGEKLAVVTWEKEGRVCCISLLKTEGFSALVQDMLGPMVRDLSEE